MVEQLLNMATALFLFSWYAMIIKKPRAGAVVVRQIKLNVDYNNRVIPSEVPKARSRVYLMG